MNGLYFSGNGNTKYCMELFCTLTGGKAYSIEDTTNNSIEQLQNDTEIALGYPTHYSNIPVIMKEFILKHGDFFKNKKVFIIVTMGLFSGDGAGCSARLLRKQGAKILGGFHLLMPDSIGDVKMLKKPIEKNLETISKTEEKIKELAANMNKQEYPQDGLSFFHRLAGLFGQRLWFIPTAKGLRTKLNIHSKKCIGCGICAVNCPTKSIIIKDGKTVFDCAIGSPKCTICYRCVNNCPEKAITLIGKEVLEQCTFANYQKQRKN